MSFLRGLFEQAAPLLFDGAVAAVKRRMPDGSVAEHVIETDTDANWCRQARDEYQSQPDDIGIPYVRE